MTVIEAINRLDTIKPNRYGQEEKIRWLSHLDGIIKREIIDTHEGGGAEGFSGYGEDSLDAELLVPAPYDDIYVKWMEAQIDYASGEFGRYNNTSAAYNSAYIAFSKAYHREHCPKSSAGFYNF